MQWRSRGYLDRQEVLHDYSEQGCALVGLFLIMCEVGVRCRRCLRVKQAWSSLVWGVMRRCELGDPR